MKRLLAFGALLVLLIGSYPLLVNASSSIHTLPETCRTKNVIVR